MKIKLFIFCFLFYGGILFAQENNISKQVQTVQKESEDNYIHLSNKITILEADFESLQKEMKETKDAIKSNAGIDLEVKKEKIEQREHYLIQTAAFVKSASKSFRAIDASIAQSSYMQDVIKLNNPTNDDLGFSLKSVLDELIQKHILSKDKKLGKAGKVNDFVTSLIEHPITEIAKSAVPAINTVVSFVSNLSFGSKKITQEDFKDFTAGLKKYVEHYEGLANATKEYESNLQQIQIRTAALEVYLEAFAQERINTFYPNDDILKEQNILTFNELLRKYYSDDVVKSEIQKIAKEKGDILKDDRCNYPITALNQARYIQDELKSLSNQYISVNYSYYDNISITLEKSKELNEEYVPKIEKKLKGGLINWIDKYSVLVDVDDVKKEFNELIK